MQFGNPIALQGSQSQVDFLGTFATNAPIVSSNNMLALNSYSSLLVIATASGAFLPYCATAGDTSLETGVPSPGTSIPLFSTGLKPVGQGGLYQGIMPFANKPGDLISCSGIFSGAGVGPNSIWVYGLTNVTPPCRPDGRAYPVGAFAVQGLATGTIVAAPGAGLRLFVKTANLLTNAAAVLASGMTGVIGGTVFNLVQACGAAGYPTSTGHLDFSEGILLDPNTGISLNSTIAPAYIQGNAVYDIVV